MSIVRFEDLPVEALTEVAKEKFEEAVWATEKALAKQLVRLDLVEECDDRKCEVTGKSAMTFRVKEQR